MWGFPRIRGTLLGVLIIRTIVYWGLYWGPPMLGNYHVQARVDHHGMTSSSSQWTFKWARAPCGLVLCHVEDTGSLMARNS